MGKAMKPGVMVIGSSNLDTSIYLDRFASPGETVHAAGKKVSCGGKGANQAVAAARAGADVTFMTALGDDPEGKILEERLSEEGMTLSIIRKQCDTGQAFIEIDSRSENRIAVIGGANMVMTPEDVKDASSAISGRGILVVQNEIPSETDLAAMKIASDNGTMTIYNPAPCRPMAEGMLSMTDILAVNETEFRYFAGTDDLEKGSAALISRGAKAVVVTLGKAGCFYAYGGRSETVPAPETDAIDTSGAGDTFVGYLAASLSNGSSIEESVRLATAAASISCTRKGAMDGIPTIGEIRF
jgi:ribokinase